MQSSRLQNLIKAIALRLDRMGQMDDEAEKSDPSEDDAWLDAQMRSFFRAEYGKAEPPRDISVHLVYAIRRYHEKHSRRASGVKGTLRHAFGEMRRLPGAIYRLGSRPDTSRLLSGTMVAALLVMAMGPKMMQSLSSPDSTASFATYERSTDEFWSAGRLEKAVNVRLSSDLADDFLSDIKPAPPPVSPGLEVEQPRLFLERRIGEDLDALTPQQENELHPIELGLGERNSTAPIETRNRPLTIQW